MATWNANDIPDLSGKCILVTGAASGIGYEAAPAMAQHGAEMLVVDRNEAAGRAALDRIRALRADAKVKFLPLDLGELQSIGDFAAALVVEGKLWMCRSTTPGSIPSVTG